MNQHAHAPRTASLVLVSVAALALGGCGACNDPVGRICDLGATTPGEFETLVSSQSLDCQNRLCLKIQMSADKVPPAGFHPLAANQGLCTAFCEEDSDCDKVPESPCVTGFTCGIPLWVGPFCCEKVCICKDYVVVPEGGTIETPAACDPGNTANACCNLPDRAGNPMYSNCT